jgi:Ni/Co efflux regulator RcnB
MSKRIFVPAFVAAMLVGTLPAGAQERGYHNDRTNSYQARDERQRADQPRNQDRYQRSDDGRSNERRDGRWDDRRDGRDHDNARGNWGRTADYNSGYDGYGPDHNMHRGQRLPSRYRNHQYVVNNWQQHHLSRPPRGHQWVQVGADYVLVAAATGLIVNAIMGQ